MILSIHQPSYFPWLGLLSKIANSDAVIVLDEVQLSDNAFQHRNLFLTATGSEKFLSIPFTRKNYLARPFGDLEIASTDWSGKHWAFLRNSYRKHPFAAELWPVLEPYYTTPYERLIDPVLASMVLCLSLLNLSTRVVLQSTLDYDRSLHKGDLVLALCQAAGASCYLSGTGAQAYLDDKAFQRHLPLRYTTFTHPVYPQLGRSIFVPGLSSLDLLFNVGIERAGQLLRHGIE